MTIGKPWKAVRFRPARFAAMFGTSILAIAVASPAAANMQTETVLYSFAGGTSDGAQPFAGLYCCDSSGNLYGATYSGGSTGQGIVYSITPTGTETVLYSLPGISGSMTGPAPLALQSFLAAISLERRLTIL